MKRYRVTGSMTISMSVVVEAKSSSEARRLAKEAPIMSLCRECAQGDDLQWSTSGDLDGEVRIRRDGVEEE